MKDLKVPVLLVAFNRPDKTRRVIQQIAKYEPEHIYISCDAPRLNNTNDIIRCEEVRNIVNAEITWNCKKHRLYHTENQGCKKAVSQALTWFFKNEPYGIILEDDCLPDISFFVYAGTLLKQYQGDKRIFSISGSNFGFTDSSNESYFFSRYMNMWGWASWRRVSDQVDYDLKDWQAKSVFSKYFYLVKNLGLFHKDFDWGWILYWKDLFDQVATSRFDTWDYQWFYSQFNSSALTIYPNKNLIENIGFDADATHTDSETTNRTFFTAPLNTLKLPLKAPEKIIAEQSFDEHYVKKVWAAYTRQSIFWHIRTTKTYEKLKSFLKRGR